MLTLTCTPLLLHDILKSRVEFLDDEQFSMCSGEDRRQKPVNAPEISCRVETYHKKRTILSQTFTGSSRPTVRELVEGQMVVFKTVTELQQKIIRGWE